MVNVPPSSSLRSILFSPARGAKTTAKIRADSVAIANEIEAQKFYQDAADRVEDPHLKAMFAGFVVEEKKHEENADQ